MKETMDDTDGEISMLVDLGESILWKWIYYPKQSTDSMQFLLNLQWHYLQN